jgi:hypothetical protein
MVAMSIPGTILSQLGMHTMPSKQWRGPSIQRNRQSAHGKEASTSSRRDPSQSIVDANRIEDERHTACLSDQPLNQQADLIEMGVAGMQSV